jgi:hypothetical protein
MMLRQEAALDRSIDRKVRILLRLRKELTNPPVAPAGQDEGTKMGDTEDVLDSDIMPANSQGVEAVQDIKMRDRCGNVYENKGPLWKTGREAGISMKTNVLSPSRAECY